MKRWNGKSFLAGFVVCAVMMGSTVAFAAPVKKTIEAVFGQINLVIDGKPVDKETLLYNGTTYVPLRAAAEVLGKEVTYHDATKTAYLGTVPAGALEVAPTPSDTKTEQAPASDQAALELEYEKFMADIYDDVMGSIEKVETETAQLESDPELLLDEKWLKDYKAVIDEFSKQLDKLNAYDKAKVPEVYKEFHNAFVSGSQNFKKGVDMLFYGMENLDEDALVEAQDYIDEAVLYFDEASELMNDFE